jgi:hypothetical protein
MFRFLLVLPNGTPLDPAVFVTVIPNWRVGEECMLGDGSRFRILDMNRNMSDGQLEELYSSGIDGIWMVEPAD